MNDDIIELLELIVLNVGFDPDDKGKAFKIINLLKENNELNINKLDFSNNLIKHNR